MKRFWQLILIFIWPNGCLNSIVKESQKINSSEKEKDIRNREGKRIKELRKSFIRSGGLIIGIFICGYISAKTINLYAPVNTTIVTNIRVIASLLIAWAVLSKLTKEIESFDGITPLEQLNKLIFKLTYFIGVSLIICSIYLEPTPVISL